jgi:hypothetical protein
MWRSLNRPRALTGFGLFFASRSKLLADTPFATDMAPQLAKIASAIGVFLAPLSAHAAEYYVAPTGSDSAAGSMAAPFASWARAQTAVAAGDTVYFRGGTYKYTQATSTCGGSTSAKIAAVVLNKSGVAGKLINYVAYPGETPIFDFSGISDKNSYNCRQIGVNVQADYLHLKGLEFTGTLQLNNLNHESWCVYVNGGSNNTFEMLDAHHNMGPGFFIQDGGHNTFLNCDSHENEDTLTSNGDGQSADGFGCHPTKSGDTGNLFRGCRAWWNTDDNWDFINSAAPCTVEYSWAWYAGYKPDTLSGGAPVSLAAGNGNGIKAGGYGDPQTDVPSPTPQHVVRFNISFYNKTAGFYANHHIVSPFFYNNTAFNNGVDYDMLGLNGTTVTSVGILRNNIGYSNNGKPLTRNMTNSGPISDQFNSWDANLNLTVKDSDFQSVTFQPAVSCPPTDKTCFAGMASARASDGSLPTLPFLRLTAQSPLIDRGTDVMLPYVGKAPDLGGFEYGAVASGGGSATGGSATGGSATSGAATGGAATGGAATGGDSSGAGASPVAGAPGAGGADGAITAGAGSAPIAGSAGNNASGSSSAGATAAGGANGGDSSGCSCRLAAAGGTGSGAGAALGALLLGSLWRRRRAQPRARRIVTQSRR